MPQSEENSVDRRNFLKLAAGGAAALVASGPTANAQEAPPPREAPASGEASGAEVLTADRTGADFMVDVLKSLGFDYAFSNPGESFRGLQESLINYGGNRNPEWITCMHEASSVSLARGYYDVEGKPQLVFAHGTVGLQHAALPIYSAFSDEKPVYVILGNTLDATERRPGVDWGHSVQDAAAMVRDYTKWDDTPNSLAHFAESAVRAYKIAMTPPQMPVVLVADATMQEHPIPKGSNLHIPKLTSPTPPVGDSAAVAEVARLLVEAEHPLLMSGDVGHTEAGMKHLVELAEVLQAPVVGEGFPSRHPLNQAGVRSSSYNQVMGIGARRGSLIADADVILGLHVENFYGEVHSMRDQLFRGSLFRSRTKPGAKLISITTGDLYIKANYQNFQRYQEVDLAIAADAEATLPSLIEAVKRLITADRRRAFQERGAMLAKAHQEILDQSRREAAQGWDANPISTARLTAEIWAQIKHKDWSLVSGRMGDWPMRLWNFDKHYRNTGGAGVSQNAPVGIGAALANRKYGRLSVLLQDDGDLMYAPGVLWTAAHHRIPLLSVMHNNRAYHQEIMHLQRMANRHNRAPANAHIGCAITDPDIDYAKIAQGMGWYAEGPITDPKDVGPALKRAIAVVERGQPALLDTVTQPR